VDRIRTASSIAKVGFEAALEHARPGMTEAEIVAEVEKACRLNGSEGFPHHTMVTSGKNRKHLEWWWYCGRRKLRKGDPWNLDFGTMFNGYCCDIARSFCLGEPSDRHTNLYERLVEAEEVARQSMMPGIMASEVNKAVSQEMEHTFKGDFSGIGHGVGLEVHERPFVGYEYIENDSVYADMRLEKNMVISVEPQVYVNGLGYLQIEDEFVVTKNGGQPLSTIVRELWH
jgi:Xaa-Pro aminopeptidase